MKINEKIYNSTYLINIFVIILIFVLSLVQLFPQGYFFSSGDAVQIVSFKSWFSNNYSSWSDNHIAAGGAGIHNSQFVEIPYYLLTYSISKIFNLKINHYSVLNHLIFYLGSYYSISFYLKNSFKFLSNFEILLISLSYIINIIVFYTYFYTWGYTPFYFIYIFIPLYFAYVDIFFKLTKFRNIILFSIKIIPILILSNICFRNPAFLLSILLFINLYIVFKIFFKPNKIKIIKLFLINFLFLLTLLPSFFGILLYINEIILGVRDQVWDPLQWVKNQAATFPNPFFLFEGYGNVKKNFFISYQYLIFVFLILLIFLDFKKYIQKNKKFYKEKKFFFLFFLILLLFIHNKGIDFLNEKQIYNLFVNSIFYIFRSSDKVVIYYPFVITVLIIVFSLKFKNRSYIFLAILIFNSLISFPLIIGNLKTNYDLTVGENKNFTESEYSMIKKYSKDYEEIINILNRKNDFKKYGLLNIPFTGFTSGNWSNYQKNQHVGFDPYLQFFNHKVFSFNDWATKDMDFIGRAWNQSNINDDWYKNIFKLFPCKYVIFHKDTHKFIYEETIEKIELLEKELILERIYSGEQLVLFELNSKYLSEIINIPNFKIKTHFKSYNKFSNYLNKNQNVTNKEYIIEFGEINYYNYEELLKNKKIKNINLFFEELIFKNSIESYNSQKFNINYEKDSSYKYFIELKNLNSNHFTISFLQSFSPFWKIISNDGNNFELAKHFKCNGYANCYTIKTQDKNLNLTLEYIPQKYLQIIIAIEIIILFLSFLLILILRKKNDN
tara:strand:+ start:2326 stop:4668 length:2343 start_codon:yes stop_codon:yes gene_type:complete